MAHRRMTKKVRRGLAALAEYGRIWLEADGFETPAHNDQEHGTHEVDDIGAALAWVEEGGLS